MNFPFLFASDSTGLENNAIGVLNECLKCEVTEERNGKYELVLDYPIEGTLYSKIVNRGLIKCKSNQTNEMQIFRIYEISKPISGIVTVKAAHISYDLIGYYAPAITAESITSAISQLEEHSKPAPFPFKFWTDKSTIAHFDSGISSVRSCLGGRQGSLLDVYGGEFEFNNYTIKLYNHRGQDRGVTIAYGKNLTDLKQDENVSNVYSGVLPYWHNDDEGYIGQNGSPIYVDPPLGFEKIYTLDLSNDFDEMPTEEQMKAAAEKYIEENNFGKPNLNLKVSFIQLDQTEEYKGQALLEKVYLCDKVHIEYKDLGINATAKATKVIFDVLADRVKSIQLGTIATKLTDTIVQNSHSIEKIESPTYLKQAANKATDWITKGNGYITAIKDESGAWKELIISEKPDYTTSANLWRWTLGGFGFSKTGYNGNFTTAITADGQIVADFITTGTLNANIIKAGTLKSQNGDSFFDLEGGIIHTNKAELIGGTIGGWNIGSDSIYAQKGTEDLYYKVSLANGFSKETFSDYSILSFARPVINSGNGTSTETVKEVFKLDGSGSLFIGDQESIHLKIQSNGIGFGDSKVNNLNEEKFFIQIDKFNKGISGMLNYNYLGIQDYDSHNPQDWIFKLEKSGKLSLKRFTFSTEQWGGGTVSYNVRDILSASGGFVISANNGNNALFLQGKEVLIEGNFYFLHYKNLGSGWRPLSVNISTGEIAVAP